MMQRIVAGEAENDVLELLIRVYYGVGDGKQNACNSLHFLDYVQRTLHLRKFRRQVACGKEHTCVVNDSGELFTFGVSKHGSLGQGVEDGVAFLPLKVELRSRVLLVDAASNGYHSLVVMDDGSLMAFGDNSQGELGLCKAQTATAPIPVPAFKGKKVKMTACGVHFSALLTSDDELWVMGYGLPVRLRDAAASRHEPGVVHRGEMRDDERMIQLAAGDAHLILLTDFGNVYTLGEGRFGKLGHGSEADCYSPRRVRVFDGTFITQVAAGSEHSMFIDQARGRTFSCGSSQFGQLGHGKLTSIVTVPEPMRLNRGHEVAQMASCGSLHSMVLSTSGRLQSFGATSYGMLGKEAKFWASPYPEVVQSINSLLGEDRIKQLGAGSRHTVILTENNRIYMYGDAKLCAAGFHPTNNCKKFRHLPRIVELPTKRETGRDRSFTF